MSSIIMTSCGIGKKDIKPQRHGDKKNSYGQIINIHIEKLPEGVYLATSDNIQGLVAQVRTIWETLEIARDVARKLLEAQKERQND